MVPSWFLSFFFCLGSVTPRRIDRHSLKTVIGDPSPDDHRQKYPKCFAKLDEAGLSLQDLQMTSQEVAALIELPPNDCNWWDSYDCAAALADEAVHEYFLRMSLVGQPDPRGPTLYTPKAQEAVVKAMRKFLKERLSAGNKSPDLELMADIFRSIDVEDTGSVSIEIINAFASVFNRGSADTVYRSKDVKTRLYDLSTWGENMPEKISKYNDLTYTAKNGTVSKALDLSYWRLLGRHSFVYKLPPEGIPAALQDKILNPFEARRSTMGDPSNMAAFEMAERWIRNLVILHPYTDSNGRTARVSLNILLMLNGLVPMVMEKQDEDMTSSPDELRDKVCEGMVYTKTILRKLPELRKEMLSESWLEDSANGVGGSQLFPMGTKDARCCAAADSLNGGEEMCVSVPKSLGCDKYGDLKQSMRYLPWKESEACGEHLRRYGSCSDITTRAMTIMRDTMSVNKSIQISKAGVDTKLYRMTAYRSQLFSYPRVRNVNLASDIGELVFMANAFDRDGRILSDDREIVIRHELLIKIAQDEEVAATHYVNFKDGEPPKDRKMDMIDTVGVERADKHMWISLPASLECDANSSPGEKCAWKDVRSVKAIHTACLMSTEETGETGEKHVFEQVYKRFSYPHDGGGEAALDDISKSILRLYRKAFEECKDVWPETVSIETVTVKDTGMENRCCCFNEATSKQPDWVKHGVCLRDVGPRTVFADTWSMIRVPEEYLDGVIDCSQAAGMALYQVDPRHGRCLSHHPDHVTSVTFNFHAANMGNLEENVTFEHVNPTLRQTKWPLAKYWKDHAYVCDADIGMHHSGNHLPNKLNCTCAWAGDDCDSPKESSSGQVSIDRSLSGKLAFPSIFLVMLAAFAMLTH